jgi:hypothetical protein
MPKIIRLKQENFKLSLKLEKNNILIGKKEYNTKDLKEKF